MWFFLETFLNCASESASCHSACALVTVGCVCGAGAWWSLMCLSPVWRRPADAVDSHTVYRVCAYICTYQIPLVCSVRYLVRKEMCKAAPMAVTLSETHPHTPHTAGGARGHTRATAPARATQHHSSSPSTHCGHTGYQVAWVHSFCGPRCRDTPATVLAAGHGP